MVGDKYVTVVVIKLSSYDCYKRSSHSSLLLCFSKAFSGTVLKKNSETLKWNLLPCACARWFTFLFTLRYAWPSLVRLDVNITSPTPQKKLFLLVLLVKVTPAPRIIFKSLQFYVTCVAITVYVTLSIYRKSYSMLSIKFCLNLSSNLFFFMTRTFSFAFI